MRLPPALSPCRPQAHCGWRRVHRCSNHLLGGTPTHFKGVGGSGWAAPGLVWFGPGLLGGCALQHTMRGNVKQRGAGRPPLESRRRWNDGRR